MRDKAEKKDIYEKAGVEEDANVMYGKLEDSKILDETEDVPYGSCVWGLRRQRRDGYDRLPVQR